MARRTIDRKETNSSERLREEYRDKIRRHKLSSVYRFLLVIAAILVLLAIVYVQYKNHIYTSYDIVSTLSLDASENSEIMQLGDNILIYSSDGARCVNAKGEALWNQTFEMQSMIVTTNEDVVAIGDYNGREIYVLDSTQKICEINTTMPIRNIAVAATGRVAVAVADTKVTWIHIYEPDGTWAYEIRTTMGQSGYPIAFALSPNGELLGASFVYVDSGILKSNVAFYNFGSVGSNKSDYLVNTYTCQDAIVPHLRFLNANTAIAVADDSLMVFEGSQKPVLLAQHYFDDEVKAVYQSGDYVGILFRSDKLDMQNKIEVYSSDAKKKGTYYFNLDYDEIFFTEDYFVAYNTKECQVQTFDELVKYEGNFLSAVDLMYPVGRGKGYKYILVGKDAIDTIQLK